MPSKSDTLARGALLLSLALSLPAHANSLVQEALDAGSLDLETALLYQVYAIRGVDSLPVEYREVRAPAVCGTPGLSAVRDAAVQLSADGRERVAKAVARPGLTHRHLSPAGHFRIHYSLEGVGAVQDVDVDDNGVPDYVDVVAAVLDSTWMLQVGTLGYQAPPSDEGRGGGGEYDAYIVELGRSNAYGYVYPEAGGGRTSYSYMELDNNYTDSIYTKTRGLEALRVTVAHEFFHVIHFGYYQGNDASWWREATSTWMEEVAYPEADDYLQYVRHFLAHPDRSLNSGSGLSSDYHMYGASLFAHFLDQRFERSLIRAIWEEVGRQASASLEHFDRPLRQGIGRSLGEAVSEFAVWNYFTGSRHREGFYREGDKYTTQVPAKPIRVVPEVAVEESGEVDHLGSAYIRLEPQLRPGGVELQTLELEGQWSRQLLLISPDSLGIEPVNRSTVGVAGWDRHEEIVLVLVATELTGLGFGYRVAAQFDPALTDGVRPVAFRLGESYPNPFKPEVHGSAVFPFNLTRASLSTWMSIFGLDGQLVRRIDLGQRSARSDTWMWNGNNQQGQPVASGVYYYVLEADEGRAARTLALVRGRLRE